MRDLLAHVATCTKGCHQIHDSVHVVCAEGLRLLNVDLLDARATERMLNEMAEVPSARAFTAEPPPITDWRRA